MRRSKILFAAFWAVVLGLPVAVAIAGGLDTGTGLKGGNTTFPSATVSGALTATGGVTLGSSSGNTDVTVPTGDQISLAGDALGAAATWGLKHSGSPAAISFVMPSGAGDEVTIPSVTYLCFNGTTCSVGWISNTGTHMQLLGGPLDLNSANIIGAGTIASTTPYALFGMSAVTFSNGTALQGYNIGQNWTATAITGKLTTAGAGTGSVTVTATDGTNTCTYTGTCAGALPATGWAGTATFRFPATNGSGTGCVFTTANPSLTWSVSASNCGTTTPIGSIAFEGKYQ